MSLVFRSSPLARRHAGFTLIEIMVVVVIMGVLAALVVPRLMGRTDDARILAAKQDIATLMQALKLYRLDNQRYPTTEQGLQALITRPTNGFPTGELEKWWLCRSPQQRSLGKSLSIFIAGYAQ